MDILHNQGDIRKQVSRPSLRCLAALNECRQRCMLSRVPVHHALSQASQEAEQIHSGLPGIPSTLGADIASRFALEIERILSADELDQLIDLLHQPFPHENHDRAQLEQSLLNRLEEFYIAETDASGKDRARLGAPGGAPDSSLGLILHMQSEDDVAQNFWNPQSPTMNLLQQKGINEMTAFGTDWHLRATTSFRRGEKCPVRTWTRELQNIHHCVSADILEMLPLPFVLTASSCARDNIRKHLSKRNKRLQIELLPPFGVLTFDLDFRPGYLRRIIAHVHHPVAAFFMCNEKKLPIGVQLDSGFNFFMWLLAIPHTPYFFTLRYSNPHKRLYALTATPLMEMWTYIQRESQESRILNSAEYSPSFISWASRYLQRDSMDILAQGSSLARMVAQQILSKVHRVLAERRQVRGSLRRPLLTPARKTHTRDREAIQSKNVDALTDPSPEVVPKGTIERQTLLQHDAITNAAANLANYTDINEIASVQEKGEVDASSMIVERLNARLLEYCTEWSNKDVNQSITHGAIVEDNHGVSDYGKVDDFLISQQSTLPGIFRPLVDEMDVVRPYDELCEFDYQVNGLDKEPECTDIDSLLVPTSHHSVSVVVGRSGFVRIFGATYPLSFRCGTRQALEMLAIGEPLKLHFTASTIEIRTAEQLRVYEKPIERLLASPEAATWLLQLLHEKACLPKSSDHNEQGLGARESKLVLPNRRALPGSLVGGTAFKAGELRARLLQGSKFYCCKQYDKCKNLANYRLYFRGVQITVPIEANENEVFAHASLVQEGAKHTHSCIKDGGQAGDVAHRLGIHITYLSTREEHKDFWWQSSGDSNIKKLNSLVDFLENRDEVYTESQPRRFLDRNKSRGRNAVGYTS